MKKVIVFGVGQRLQRLSKSGHLNDLQILAYSDNDKSRWGSSYNGIPIIPPSRICEYPYEEIMISSTLYYNEIKKSLLSYGISEETIKPFVVKDEKYIEELAYWKGVYSKEGNHFSNGYYKELMLSIAQEVNDSFLQGEVVADFGCGPRGSLAWTDAPLVKLGIDVLANRYIEEFGEEMLYHHMVYVTCSETIIPVPNQYVDYICTINSLDHVERLDCMISELLRILKPGGTLLASFNLHEPGTECEPQTLTEELLQKKLLCYFNISSYRIGNSYEDIRLNHLLEYAEPDKKAVLWVRGEKKI